MLTYLLGVGFILFYLVCSQMFIFLLLHFIVTHYIMLDMIIQVWLSSLLSTPPYII